MKKEIKETLDTNGEFRCVRFSTGEVGVVDKSGTPLIVLGQCQKMKFATHEFIKVTNNGQDIFIDMMNGEPYARMPELINIGKFELTSIGGFLCTRTKKIYETPGLPVELLGTGKHSMYLLLPHFNKPNKDILSRMTELPKNFQVCLLNGDDSQVYWLIDKMPDGTPLVMDDDGNYFHAEQDRMTCKAVKKHLGKVDNAAGKALMAYKIRELREEIEELSKKREAAVRARAEEERQRQIQELTSAEPFQIGGKWGLRLGGRIAIPPKYRTLEAPVGHFCVVETYPGIWGVVALDGKVEVEAKYEKVVLLPDGTAELTVYGGKVIYKKLP